VTAAQNLKREGLYWSPLKEARAILRQKGNPNLF